MTRPSEVLVENVRQARKVRVLTAVFLVLAAAGCLWAALTARTPAPDGTAFVLAPLGVLAAAGLCLYARRYVVSMRLAGRELVVRTAWPSGELRIPLERLRRRTLHDGEMFGTDGPSVDAPWLTLRVAGYRVPFVVDRKAEHVQVRAILRLRG